MSQRVKIVPEDMHNLELLGNVHPGDWKNPQAAERYNLVVLGAGPAGLIAAAGAAGLGAKVALIERHFMGGDCLNVGCVPSKALIRCAKAFADVRDAKEFGIEVPAGVKVNFAAVMERMRRLRAGLSPVDSAKRYTEKLKVDVFLGSGKFTGPDTVEVDGQTLRFRKAAITVGNRAAELPIPGLKEAGFLTNETVFSLTELPRRLAVIGAGPIGCELAQAFARFGSAVTLLEVMPQILPREDREAAEIVEKALIKDGIKIITGCQITQAEKRGSEKLLKLKKGENELEEWVDEILLGVGRAPNTEGLGLEAAGVAYDKTGVIVDDRLRTSNRHIFAAGDIASKYKFTHMADALARILIQNALFLGRARPSSLVVPWATYTDPEIAHVGLYESEAKERGIATQTFMQEFKEVDRAVLDGESGGFVKVLAKAGSDQIVGATLVARHAGDMISEISLAMVAKVGLKTLARTIHPYPTQAEAIRKVGDAYNRTRLTPLVKGLFAKWLAWGR